MTARDRFVAPALATFFVVVQFYTSLAALSPTPPVGYVFASAPVAAALVGLLALAALGCGVCLWRDRAAPAAASRRLLAAWIGSAAFSGLLGFDPLSSVQIVGIMLLTGLFHVALVRYEREPGVAAWVVGAYLVAGLAASLAALQMFALRTPAALWSLNHGRAAGVFVTANQFAAYLVAFIFVAVGAALAWTGALRRLAVGAAAAGLAALLDLRDPGGAPRDPGLLRAGGTVLAVGTAGGQVAAAMRAAPIGDGHTWRLFDAAWAPGTGRAQALRLLLDLAAAGAGGRGLRLRIEAPDRAEEATLRGRGFGPAPGGAGGWRRPAARAARRPGPRRRARGKDRASGMEKGGHGHGEERAGGVARGAAPGGGGA